MEQSCHYWRSRPPTQQTLWGKEKKTMRGLSLESRKGRNCLQPRKPKRPSASPCCLMWYGNYQPPPSRHVSPEAPRCVQKRWKKEARPSRPPQRVTSKDPRILRASFRPRHPSSVRMLLICLYTNDNIILFSGHNVRSNTFELTIRPEEKLNEWQWRCLKVLACFDLF